MVLRVFGIHSETIEICLYMDPDQLRLDGDLVFKGKHGRSFLQM